MDELEKQAEDLSNRLKKAVAAEGFENTPSGKFAVDYLENRASILNRKIIGAKPLEREEYLETHGRLDEINRLMSHIKVNASAKQAVAEKKKEVDGQLKNAKREAEQNR